jgi:6-phosphogluconolactonase
MKLAILRSSSVVLLATVFACGDNGSPPGDDVNPPDASPPPPPPPQEAPKAVYILSNEADANRIVVFARASDGTLTPGNAYATGGRGSAGGLGSQGALAFDAASERFFAVNAGDASISMLSLESDGSLVPRSKVSSGGVKPVSITVSGDLVYVVNSGDATTPANIAGFRIQGTTLATVAGSTQPLSAALPGPAQIQFAPDGKSIVVTEKGTNMIDTFTLANGVASRPDIQASAGQTPFGFAWSPSGQLLVSEAFGGGAGLGAATSYTFSTSAKVSPISSSIKSTQSAPCWVVYAKGHAYTTNTASNTISAYTVGSDGHLVLDQADGIAATTKAAPIDADVSDGDGFLYVLDAKDHAIGSYAIGPSGALASLPGIDGVAANAVGLVAR